MLDPAPPDIAAIFDGLRRTPPCIASKLFYDSRGSQLFEEITRLPEYYVTRTEASIMRSCGPEIAQAVGSGRTIIELGAGNLEKARRLCELIHPARLVAIDLSIDFLDRAASALRRDFPGIDIRTLAADLGADIALPADLPTEGRLFFYPGSSIGNFDRPEALALLARMRAVAGSDGALLIGVDLQKDLASLNSAYNDAAGITAQFNLNILNHVNTVAGTQFDLRDWRHLAFYNEGEARIEMHLEAIRPTRIGWRSDERLFRQGERIHTENSYKYKVADFEALLAEAGFPRSRVWTDEREWFAVILAHV